MFVFKESAWRKCLLAVLAVSGCAAPYAHADDFSRVLTACGTPTRTEPSKHVIGFTTHVVHYKNITLRFASADSKPADGSGFLIGYRGPTEHSLDKEVVGGWLPCFHSAFAVQPAPQLTTRPSSDSIGYGAGFALFLIVLGVCFYLLPCLVASARGVAKPGGIILLNLLLGWTVVGWLVALIWAASAESHKDVRARTVNYDQLASAINAQQRQAAPPPPPSLD